MRIDNIARALGSTAYSKAESIENPQIVEVSSSTTINSTHIGKKILCINGIGIDITIPNDTTLDIPIGSEFVIIRYGVGNITFVAGSGVTINSIGSALSMTDQNTGVIACKTSADTWILIGNLS